MVPRIAKPACRWVSILFLAIALAGMIDGPLIGHHGMIATDLALNMINFLIGLILLSCSVAGESAAAFGLYSSGGVCLVAAFAALFHLGSSDIVRVIDGTLVFTRSVAYLHITSAVIMFILGSMNTASKQLFRE